MRGASGLLSRPRPRPRVRWASPVPGFDESTKPEVRMAMAPRATAEGASLEGPRTILLVDDESDILDALRTYLERTLQGVQVLRATSARDALRLLESRRVDLVITDLRMPEMDGLEFIHRVRRSRPSLPVFLMTAYVHSELAAQAKASPEFQEFIAKPIDADRLVELTRDYLGA